MAGGISFGVGAALAPAGKVLVATYGRTAIRTLGPAVTRYLFTGVMSGANGAITGAAVGGINAWWEDGEAQEIAFAALEGGFIGSVMGLGAGLGSGAWRRYSYSRVAIAARNILGQWKYVVESMSDRARAYQQQITGRTGQAFFVNGVKFDGVGAQGLLDAKGPGYANFIKNGEFRPWFISGKQSLLSQAERQIAAANGTAITWHVAETEAATAIQNLLRSRGLQDITVVHTPPAP